MSGKRKETRDAMNGKGNSAVRRIRMNPKRKKKN